MKKNLKKLILFPNQSISDGLKKLDESGLQIIIITDEDNNLIGTVTDGDIRKGLIKGITLSDKIIKVANLKPKFVYDTYSNNELLKTFNDFNYRALPVINAEKKLLDCYFINDFIKIKKNNSPLLIMAGGFGKRLGILTKEYPKPMLEINKKPLLHFIIEKAIKENFHDIFISVYFKSEIIKSYFGNGEKFNINIKYIDEKKPLGTGGCLKLLPNTNEPIVVVNGDVLTNEKYTNLLDFHTSTSSDITMAVFNHDIQNPFGVVKTNGFKLIEFEEKPVWTTKVNAGMYVIQNSVKNYINENETISMPNVIKRMNNDNKKCSVYTMSNFWIDIGTKNQFDKADEIIKEGFFNL